MEDPGAPAVTVYFVLGLGALTGGLVKGLSGFGSAIILAGVWAFFSALGTDAGPLHQVVATDCITSTVIILPLLWITSAWKTGSVPLIATLGTFSMLGIPIGSAMLVYLNQTIVEVAMGLVLCLLIAMRLLSWRQLLSFLDFINPVKLAQTKVSRGCDGSMLYAHDDDLDLDDRRERLAVVHTGSSSELESWSHELIMVDNEAAAAMAATGHATTATPAWRMLARDGGEHSTRSDKEAAAATVGTAHASAATPAPTGQIKSIYLAAGNDSSSSSSTAGFPGHTITATSSEVGGGKWHSAVEVSISSHHPASSQLQPYDGLSHCSEVTLHAAPDWVPDRSGLMLQGAESVQPGELALSAQRLLHADTLQAALWCAGAHEVAQSAARLESMLSEGESVQQPTLPGQTASIQQSTPSEAPSDKEMGGLHVLGLVPTGADLRTPPVSSDRYNRQPLLINPKGPSASSGLYNMQQLMIEPTNPSASSDLYNRQPLLIEPMNPSVACDHEDRKPLIIDPLTPQASSDLEERQPLITDPMASSEWPEERKLRGVCGMAGTLEACVDRSPKGVCGKARALVRRHAKLMLSGSVAGICSGIMAGLTGMGGPPLMLLFQSLALSKDLVRGTNAWLNILTLPRFVTYIAVGLFTRNAIGIYISCSLLHFIGLMGGHLLASRVSQEAFGRMLTWLMCLSAALLFMNAAGFGQ